MWTASEIAITASQVISIPQYTTHTQTDSVHIDTVCYLMITYRLTSILLV